MALTEAIRSLREALQTLSPAVLSVAYSGGVDSTVLLALLRRYHSDFPQHPLQAIHVHHGLSPHADEWAAHCQRTCQLMDIPLHIVSVTVKQAPRTSLEAAARDARYAALYRHATSGVVVTGQHLDDQFETMLLQLKRGAGPGGLAAMAPWQQVKSDLQLWRPLLHATREEIKAYAQEQALSWIEDESNSDVRFDRNFLRQNVLPLLTARWPGVLSAAARSARLCAEQQALLEEAAAEKLRVLVTPQNGLDVKGLILLSEAWQRQTVRLWLKRSSAQMPSEAQLSQLSALLHAKDDAQPQLNWGQWQLRRFQDILYLVSAFNLYTPPDSIWRTHSPCSLKHLNTEIRLESGGDTPTLQIRYGGFSTRFTPAGSPHSKPLKQWFKIWQVPPWERNRVAQICFEDRLLALVTPKGVVLGGEALSEKLKFVPYLALHAAER